MFTRWGAFVYRRRRDRPDPRHRRSRLRLGDARRQRLGRAVRRRLARPELGIAGGRRAARAGLRRRARHAHRALRRRAPARDATSAGVPGRDRRRRSRPRSRPERRRHHRLCRRPATGGSSATDGDAAYVVVAAGRRPTRSRSTLRRRGRARARTARRRHALQLTGYGPLTAATPAGSPSRTWSARRDGVAADRRAHPDARLRLAHRRRACRCSSPGSRSRRRSALIYFVAQQTEMSIYVLNIATMLGLALAIDYSLFMVSRFREELAPRPDRRAGGRDVGRDRRQGGRVLGLAVAIGLSGLLLVQRDRAELDRHRRRARRRSPRCSTPDVPAGDPGHARAARQRAVRRRAARDGIRRLLGAAVGARRPRRAVALGAASPTG